MVMPDELEAHREAHAERAAIVEHMAGHPRPEAECRACKRGNTLEHVIRMLAEYVSWQRDPESRQLMRQVQDLLKRNNVRIQGLGEAVR